MLVFLSRYAHLELAQVWQQAQARCKFRATSFLQHPAAAELEGGQPLYLRRQHGQLLQHVLLCAGPSMIVIADVIEVIADNIVDEQRQALKLRPRARANRPYADGLQQRDDRRCQCHGPG